MLLSEAETFFLTVTDLADIDGSSISVGCPGNCHYPILAVKNVNVREPILLNISLLVVSMYINCGLPLCLTRFSNTNEYTLMNTREMS